MKDIWISWKGLSWINFKALYQAQNLSSDVVVLLIYSNFIIFYQPWQIYVLQLLRAWVSFDYLFFQFYFLLFKLFLHDSSRHPSDYFFPRSEFITERALKIIMDWRVAKFFYLNIGSSGSIVQSIDCFLDLTKICSHASYHDILSFTWQILLKDSSQLWVSVRNMGLSIFKTFYAAAKCQQRSIDVGSFLLQIFVLFIHRFST